MPRSWAPAALRRPRAAGRRQRAATALVPRLAAASVAAGADGLILEVHPSPETALSDGYQSLNFKQFAETMALCARVAQAVGKEIGPAE